MKRNANTAPTWYQIIDSLVKGSWFETSDINYCQQIKSVELRIQTCKELEKKLINHYAIEDESRDLLKFFFEQTKCSVYRFKRNSLFPQRREEHHGYFWLIAYPQLLKFFKKHQTTFKPHEPIFYIVKFLINQKQNINYQKYNREHAVQVLLSMIEELTDQYLLDLRLELINVKPYFILINKKSYLTKTSAKSAISELLDSISFKNKIERNKINNLENLLLSLISAGKLIYYYLNHIITPTPELNSLIFHKDYCSEKITTLYILPKYHWEVETRILTSKLSIYLNYIRHQDPDLFLYKKTHVEKVDRPTRELILFDEGLFLPYVFVQQIFSDLFTKSNDLHTREKRIKKLSERLDSNNNTNWQNYYSNLSRSDFLPFAFFSSVIGAIEKNYLNIDILLNKKLEYIISDIDILTKDHYKSDHIYLEKSILDILKFITRIFLDFNKNYQYGEIGIDAYILLYVFYLKYKKNRQPNEFKKFELLLDENGVFGEKIDSKLAIHSYNSLIHKYYDSDQELLFNPLESINKNLEKIFKLLDENSLELNLLTPELKKHIKKAINKIYKKKASIFFFTGESHYEVLQNITHRLADYYLNNNLQINQSIQRYECLLPPVKDFFVEVIKGKPNRG